jgi:Sec-independent protein translocase protein TatA
MKTKIAILLLIAAFLASPNAMAKKDGNPGGWLKGEKKGWNGGEQPPGLSKKDQKKAEKEAKKAKKEAEKAKAKLEKAAKGKKS